MIRQWPKKKLKMGKNATCKKIPAWEGRLFLLQRSSKKCCTQEKCLGVMVGGG
jgi:hypothetical protein